MLTVLIHSLQLDEQMEVGANRVESTVVDRVGMNVSVIVDVNIDQDVDVTVDVKAGRGRPGVPDTSILLLEA